MSNGKSLLEKEFKRALEISRLKKQLTRKTVKKIKLELGSLSSQIDPLGDIFMVFALLAAALKDLLDITTLSSVIPGIAQIITFCCLITIPFCMFLIGGGGMAKKQIIKRILIWLVSFLGEFIPVINFLPIGTVTVIILYVLILRERRLDEYQQKLQSIATQESKYADDYEISYPKEPQKKTA